MSVSKSLRLQAAALAVLGLLVPTAQAQAEIQAALDAAYAKYKGLQEGKNADYIPALAKVDPSIYGIALVTADGKVYTAGDVKSPTPDSGKWFFRTGLPGKSGVGGGLIAVSPGKFGIAVVSPPLDEAGNSVRAQNAIADVSNALGGNPLASRPR